MWLTHPDEQLTAVANAYVELLSVTLNSGKSEKRNELRDAATAPYSGTDVEDKKKFCEELNFDELALKDDRDVVGPVFAKSCPIEFSWPALLFLAHKYYDNPFEALRANAMVGGENVHRGGILGPIIGSLNPDDATMAENFGKLVHAKDIDAEILAAVETAL